MLHDLANGGGFIALKQAAEDREVWRHRERMSKIAVQQKTTDDTLLQPVSSVHMPHYVTCWGINVLVTAYIL